MEWVLFLGILALILVGSSSGSDEPAPDEPDTEATATFGDDDLSDIVLTDGKDLHLAQDGRDLVEGGQGMI